MNRHAITALLLGTALAAGCGQRLLDFYNDHDDAGAVDMNRSHDLNGVDLNGVDLARAEDMHVGDMGEEDMSAIPDMTARRDMREVDFDVRADLKPECIALDLPGLNASSQGSLVTAGPRAPADGGDYYSPGTDTLTVEAWVYETARSSGTDSSVVVAHTGPAGSYGYYLAIDSTGHVAFADSFTTATVAAGAAYSTLTSTSTVPLATWTHIVGQVQTTATANPTLTVWINGVQDATTTLVLSSTPSQPTAPLTIGSFAAAASATPMQFVGYVHDVRISDVPRYTATFTPAVTLSSDADTLALFHFQDPIGSMSLVDSSPFMANGVPEFGAAIATPPVCE